MPPAWSTARSRCWRLCQRIWERIALSADIARFLFYVFVVIFLVLLILGLTIFRA